MDIAVDRILDIAVEAGRAILTVYNDPMQDFNITHKADSSPLTLLADKISTTKLYSKA